MLNVMDTPFAQAQLAINLYGQGKTWMDIDSATADSLTRIVQYNKAAGYTAGSLSALYGLTPVTWPIPALDSNLLDSISVNYGQKIAIDGATATNAAGSFFKLYPNPNSGIFTVAVSQEGTMRLHSMDGRELGNWAVHLGSNNMELPLHLSPGMYLATYKPNAGQQQVVRFMYQP